MTIYKKIIWFQYFILLFGILCIAWSAIFVKLAGVSGLGSAFYRMFFGSLGIIPLWYLRRHKVKDTYAVKIAILCGIIFACDIALWNTSILLSKASIATLIANLAPVWVGLGAVFILKEKQKATFWIGTAVSLVGVSIIVGVSNIAQIKFNPGNVLALIASLFYGAYLLITRKGRNSMDTVTFTAISMWASTIILFVLCLCFGTQLSGYSCKAWLSLGGVGLISQLGGWLAINYALGYIQPTIASVSLLSQSVFTALFAIPVLGEKLNGVEITGAMIVLSGIYLVNSKRTKPKPFIEPGY